ncbi:ankyrin, partial [Ascobolus immersus RN42]
TDKKGDTPLVMAVKAGRTEVVKVLLSFGADPEASGWPLMCAVTSGHLSLVEVLILSDPKLAGVEYVNAMGETPLLVAVGLEWAEGVGVLLQAGADGEVVDELGMTPLRLAIEQGWMEGVKALLDGG